MNDAWAEVYCGDCHKMREITRFSDEGPMQGALIPARQINVELDCGHDHRERHIIPESRIPALRARLAAKARR